MPLNKKGEKKGKAAMGKKLAFWDMATRNGQKAERARMRLLKRDKNKDPLLSQVPLDLRGNQREDKTAPGK